MNNPTEFKYKPLCKPNQLVIGTGQTAIVTGWTPKDAIASRLNSNEFAAIGQLYSPTRGISFLIRNLLANPHVRFLVVLNATSEDRNAGACQCLMDFFKYGFKQGKTETGRDCWLVNSDFVGYIDIEISAEMLENLRKFIIRTEELNVTDAIARIKKITPQYLPAWGEPQEFPISEIESNILPGELYGHRIEGKTVAETWVKIIYKIRKTGRLRPTGYDGQIQELIDLMAIVTDEPNYFYFPRPNYLPIDRNFLNSYIPQMVDNLPYVEGVKYTYSQRLRSWFGRDQVEDIINKLCTDINAASAVANLWDSGGNLARNPDGSSDHQHNGSPCLNHIWVRIVNDELSLTATFRSNDMFSAWPANAMGLRALQKHILQEVTKRCDRALVLGPLITVSQSAHIYDDTFESADKIASAEYPKLCRDRVYDDPAGSFAIAIEGDRLCVLHLTPGSGEAVGCYKSRFASKLCQQIAASVPDLQASHALYLGTELQKAETAIALGQPLVYCQDKPLRLDRINSKLAK